jgi:hypothetical protein
MKTVLILFLLFISGCTQRNTNLLQAEKDSLQTKGAMLAIKEAELQRRESLILQREQKLDSMLNADTTRVDTTRSKYLAIEGKWSVQMTCIQTNCAGSAIGDVKSEQWELQYSGTQLVAKAMADSKLVRVYTGTAKGQSIDLSEERPAAGELPATKMVIRATMVNEKTIEGQREIIRNGSCNIIYQLVMSKLDH